MIWVDCLPDAALAAAQTAGYRRLIAIRLTLRVTGATARLYAVGGHHPADRPIAVSAALALAGSRVPIHVII